MDGHCQCKSTSLNSKFIRNSLFWSSGTKYLVTGSNLVRIQWKSYINTVKKAVNNFAFKYMDENTI